MKPLEQQELKVAATAAIVERDQRHSSQLPMLCRYNGGVHITTLWRGKDCGRLAAVKDVHHLRNCNSTHKVYSQSQRI